MNLPAPPNPTDSLSHKLNQLLSNHFEQLFGHPEPTNIDLYPQ